jgi:hypothetical protein
MSLEVFVRGHKLAPRWLELREACEEIVRLPEFWYRPSLQQRAKELAVQASDLLRQALKQQAPSKGHGADTLSPDTIAAKREHPGPYCALHDLTTGHSGIAMGVEVSGIGDLHRGRPYACNFALVYTGVIVFGQVNIRHGPESRDKKAWFLDQLLAKHGKPEWTLDSGYPPIDQSIASFSTSNRRRW